MKEILIVVRRFIKDLFNLDEDKADEQEIVESIRKNISFRGTNLWTLIFAIFIASIGLNVNSTAVIIGAMLISPLMVPIMGIGLGIGIYDSALIRKARHFFSVAYSQQDNQTVSGQPSIELLLIGEELPDHVIASLNDRLAKYGLKGTKLMIRQGLDAKQQIDLAQVKASILEDVFAKRADTLQKNVNKLEQPLPDLPGELRSLYPLLNSIFNRDICQLLK